MYKSAIPIKKSGQAANEVDKRTNGGTIKNYKKEKIKHE